MNYTEIYEKNGLSYFKDRKFEATDIKDLGSYSIPRDVNKLIFKEFNKGYKIDWHNPSCKQYIIYLSGELEVEVSGGEKKFFKQGDVLLLNDESGKGHTTRVIETGRAFVITVN
ncbi:cupin domain-containing protein [Francisella sp. SYW-9]|uniref:cupin domain-containing protein n=1 Tax=Francisella sp. SYW-9 TaxID=2610888 RepID=UPI00123D2765|nr:cupin domain-containing protein [Francisella sp. SYW-9]